MTIDVFCCVLSMDVATDKDEKIDENGAANHEALTRPRPIERSVDSHEFVELSVAFRELQRMAGTEPYKLVVLGNFGGAGVQHDRKLIGIGDRMLGVLTPDGVKAVLGHELGHVYRQQHSYAPSIGAPVLGLNPRQMEEVEADRFAVCLINSKFAAKTPLDLGSSDPTLSTSIRKAAIDDFSLADCPNVRGKSKEITSR